MTRGGIGLLHVFGGGNRFNHNQQRKKIHKNRPLAQHRVTRTPITPRFFQEKNKRARQARARLGKIAGRFAPENSCRPARHAYRTPGRQGSACTPVSWPARRPVGPNKKAAGRPPTRPCGWPSCLAFVTVVPCVLSAGAACGPASVPPVPDPRPGSCAPAPA